MERLLLGRPLRIGDELEGSYSTRTVGGPACLFRVLGGDEHDRLP
jgi:hypothetical protein